MTGQQENILDAYIMIEHLSEGAINKKDKSLNALSHLTIPMNYNSLESYDFKSLFHQALENFKKREKINNDKKLALVCYFGIFAFEEIETILKEKYNITKQDENKVKSDKFSLILAFDKNLNFIEEQLFYTMSAYVRKNKDITDALETIEQDLKDKLIKQFEEEKKDFNEVFLQFCKEYSVNEDNFRFCFVKNSETELINLHSFFIKDLKMAKSLNNANVNTYLSECDITKRQNCDSHKDSPNFNPKTLNEILAPKNYPLGRFTNEYPPRFMQQIAINLALSEKSGFLRSVNGPPGTGKTTLLKDIFADLIVRQAYEIAQLDDKVIINQTKLSKNEMQNLGILPESIADKNIMVASSNNSAVQNIVKELPKNEQIAVIFKALAEKIDYFKEVANDEENNDNWGLFALEGGASANVKKILHKLDSVVKILKELKTNQEIKHACKAMLKATLKAYFPIDLAYLDMFDCADLDMQEEKDNFDIYKAFLVLYDYVEKLQIKTQATSEQSRPLMEQYVKERNKFLKEKTQKQTNLNARITELELYRDNEPKRLEILKNKLQNTNDAKIKEKITKDIKALENGIDKSIQDNKQWFETWLTNKEQSLNALKQQIQGDNILDFSLSYEKLQKSNPWFNDKFRNLQSQLFLLALGVKKQFLCDNVEHLENAFNIWSNPNKLENIENKKELLKNAFNWINCAIPVISTTFASFSRMFSALENETNFIGNLFIDEAGQATPQSAIGALFRAKRVLAVGDPAQIEPVVTLESAMFNIIAKKHQVNEHFLSDETSIQSLIDHISLYGYYKKNGSYIGIPLWVHNRCDSPMFDIANKISYDNLMVQGRDNTKGLAIFYDIKGKARDKFVEEQAEFLKQEIAKRLEKDPTLKDEIYVISPFNNVAFQLSQKLKDYGFRYKKNVGTVHTFQGKEAKIVYLVLGADNTAQNKGAANWAVGKPNILNVAATRAKNEFYIIGDIDVYKNLGCMKEAYKLLEIKTDQNKSEKQQTFTKQSAPSANYNANFNAIKPATEKQIKFAQDLAQKHNTTLPSDYKTNSKSCNHFINEWKAK
ncbi:DEAD/DEAH box helicase [Helicobacter cetorum]|uniref:DEAD/DEAH box helicase n=1 Tax=Helicobacter cetorum TaxID=138563 RepID=UPI000CF190AC|nr:AAA domain-containing protein [Helicobacter cetorum]